jgi:hypothetical protein
VTGTRHTERFQLTASKRPALDQDADDTFNRRLLPFRESHTLAFARCRLLRLAFRGFGVELELLKSAIAGGISGSLRLGNHPRVVSVAPERRSGLRESLRLRSKHYELPRIYGRRSAVCQQRHS